MGTNVMKTGLPMESTSIMSVISKAASDPSVDVDKLERLMGMYERLESRKAETEFHAAMTAAQSEMGRVATDATNPQTRSKYATYAALDRALRPIYTNHGLALSFDTEPAQELVVRVLCHVSHKGGHCKTYRVEMPADGKGPKGNDVMTKTHAAGSAMSYGMRYLLKLIFNVAIGEDDDDGNRASIPRITEDQSANIRAMLDEIGHDQEPGFLRYMQAKRIEDIQAGQYQRAIAALEKKEGRVMIIHECEQNSEEWHALRRGIVTCSNLSAVLAKGQGKTRRTYMLKTLGERLTGQSAESYSNVHMERGHEQEPEARELYQFLTENEVRQVGIIINHDVGFSPDGLVEETGCIEVKSKLPHIHLECLLSGKVPTEHMAQIQGGLWVSEREWCDFISYCPGIKPFIKRVQRDEKRIVEIAEAVEAFYAELKKLEKLAS